MTNPGGGGRALLDIARLRADTPGCGERIHLNNAGAGLMPAPALRAARDHLELEARIGGYEAADARADRVAAAYDAVAGLLRVAPANIAFMENATAAFNQALSCVPFQRGDVLVTSTNDYVSNQIAYLSLQARLGVEVVRAPDLPEGGVDPVAVAGIIHRRGARLVALTHVPTSSGLVQPVEEVGQACRERGVLYLVDACQSVGQMPVDARAIGCDFLSATARKFLRGPRGAGFLYVSDRVLDMDLEPLMPDLRGAHWIDADLYQPAPDATRFENWEFAYALVLATGEAVRYATRLGLEPIRERAWALADFARDTLGALDGVTVLDHGRVRSAIVSVHLTGHDAVEFVPALRKRGINTSATPHGYALIDLDAKGVESTLRVSPHYYNTRAEIETLAEAVREFLRDGTG
ncbi:MAG: aminotransferase class V-fold PLP-dependent enzyme [Gammaproteobacteria bacterium]|nr:aminotransferase class V-fold PLP-dependent enzyme [Gammaproteobacteria bacterium]